LTDADFYAYRRALIKKNGFDSFVSSPPSAIAEVIERGRAKLPANYVPWVPAVVIASEDLLRIAKQYTPQLKNWRQDYPDMFTNGLTTVRKRGTFWAIERPNRMLSFTFGSMPLFTKTLEAAMIIADYCSSAPRPNLRWKFRNSLSVLEWNPHFKAEHASFARRPTVEEASD
jgi:hypothetical protein